jgi:hypothetical protein
VSGATTRVAREKWAASTCVDCLILCGSCGCVLSEVECCCVLVSLEVLRKLSIALSVSADTLVFDAERDSDQELRLQLEATQRLTAQDKELVKRFINGLLLSHEAKRLAA